MLSGINENTDQGDDDTPLSNIIAGVPNPSTADYPNWASELPERKLQALEDHTLGDLQDDIVRMERTIELLVDQMDTASQPSQVVDLDGSARFVESEEVKRMVLEVYISYLDSESVTRNMIHGMCASRVNHASTVGTASAETLLNQMVNDNKLTATELAGDCFGAYCLANGGTLDLE